MKPLDGAYAKLGRGREHMNAIQGEIDRIKKDLNGRLVGISQQLDSKSDDWVVSVDFVAQFPSVSLIVGDAAHNMRAALDYLVLELAFVDGGGVDPPRGKTQFPIVAHPSDFKTRTNLMLENVSTPHRKEVELLQPHYPWKGLGYHPLGLLADIDNDDKHRLIIATPVSFADMPLRFPHYGDNCRFNGRLSGRNLRAYPLQVGAELLRIGLKITGPNPKMRVDTNSPCT